MRFIKEQINSTNRYIKENILKIFFILYIVFIALGVISYIAVRFIPEEYIKEIYLTISEMFDSKDIVNDDGSVSAVMLFINNLQAALISSIYGFIPFFFLPLLSVILNSSIVGLVMGIVGIITTENVLLMLVKFILPHGVFEITAVILAIAAGVRLCIFMSKLVIGSAEEKLTFHLKNLGRMYVLYIIPLLIIAAFIEGVILPKLFL